MTYIESICKSMKSVPISTPGINPLQKCTFVLGILMYIHVNTAHIMANCMKRTIPVRIVLKKGRVSRDEAIELINKLKPEDATIRMGTSTRIAT